MIGQRDLFFGYLAWASCFVGFCGLHRLYTGRWVTGLLWFLTGGLFMIGQLIDLGLIPYFCTRPKMSARERGVLAMQEVMCRRHVLDARYRRERSGGRYVG